MRYLIIAVSDGEIYKNEFKTIDELNDYLMEFTPADVKYNRIKLFKIEGSMEEIKLKATFKIKI